MYTPNGTLGLFEDETTDFALPVLYEGPYDQAFDEIELLGFPLCAPFDLLQSSPLDTVTARVLPGLVGQRVRMAGYFVVRKHVTTVRQEHMNFGTWLDREGHFFDSTHFPAALARCPFRGPGIYLLTGKVSLDFGFPSLDAEHMEKLPMVRDERY